MMDAESESDPRSDRWQPESPVVRRGPPLSEIGPYVPELLQRVRSRARDAGTTRTSRHKSSRSSLRPQYFPTLRRIITLDNRLVCGSNPSAMRGAPAKFRTVLAFALLGLAGCVPSLGPIRLAAVEGQLVDRESRQPIAGAHIFQVYRGAGAPGADPHVYHSRWTQTDARGNFGFVSEITPSLRMWILKTYGPRYDFYHPEYGLVRGPTTEEAEVVLEGSLDQAQQRRMDLQVFCGSTADDPASRRLREIACPRPRGD